MEQYSLYAEMLKRLLASRGRCEERQGRVLAALNGQASRESRRLIALDKRRRDGVFFTDSKLREFAIGSVLRSVNASSVIYDPACGAGDLLVSATNAFPLGTTLAHTLKLWSRMLIGHDLHTQFACVCRRRLVLSAWHRHGFAGNVQTRLRNDWFRRIRKGCGLATTVGYANATHILMNPPFVNTTAPDSCEWSEGSINSAALFLDRAIDQCRDGTRIIAILPEVIRGGSRYSNLREKVVQKTSLNRIETYGLFDEHADVDVFVLDVMKIDREKDQATQWQWNTPVLNPSQLHDRFDVSVGSVVDFRDKQMGPWYPYLTPVSIAAWEEVFDVRLRRRFSKRVIQGPFVVIRRTSRPGDACRAVGSIVRGGKKFAVDNHLIVCKPIDGTLRSCRELIAILANSRTSTFLDNTIRCRHLTVQAVKSIPWCQDE